ncbi:type VII secretion-associated serine protease mycosin [Mycobacterium sp. SP-6446]|uniref:type VII secretion-associated serine protease mycosin n=1 Tax=Mycobacterium sp. SP-6446 TaxID=1834162 RepID=UPI00097A7A3C|nr:type VII secretion-associated serine protease mycosin [Mycobacterium sp. SP-6446]
MAAPPAGAVPPPVVAPGPPPAGPVAPPDPTEQKSVCGAGGVLPQTDFRQRPSSEAQLDYTSAWRFSRGAGQKVAVIDTGVNRHPRLSALEGGGDYVAGSDGLVDCDAHGTLVAGIIAAAPSPDDAFAGVAPEATVLSIRQNSGVYAVKGSGGAQNDPNSVSPGYGNIHTLALAISRAVDLGATVINLSEVACAPVGAGMNDAELGSALRYAYERNVVVVAAAGNVQQQGMCASQNMVGDPNLPLRRQWDTVTTVASPAWFSDYVLTVAALSPSGGPSEFSLHGPWVAVAAPGERIVSLDPGGPGLINAWQDQRGLVPINGTSFAAPFVAGVVALVRARFPDLNAGQIMELIKRTAHTDGPGPNTATGYGVIDPVAALTYHLPPLQKVPNPEVGRSVPRPPRAARDDRVRNIVMAVTGSCVVLSAVALGVLGPKRIRKVRPAGAARDGDESIAGAQAKASAQVGEIS